MLVRHLSSLFIPTAPSKAISDLNRLLGTSSNKILPALPQMNVFHCSSYIFLGFFSPHTIHEKRRRCCGLSSLVLTALHPSSKVDSQAPAVISLLLSTLPTCTNTLVYLCILSIPLRLLIYLEIILTIMTSQECHFSSLAL